MIKRIRKWAKGINQKIEQWIYRQLVFGVLRYGSISVYSEAHKADHEGSVWWAGIRNPDKACEMVNYMKWYFGDNIHVGRDVFKSRGVDVVKLTFTKVDVV